MFPNLAMRRQFVFSVFPNNTNTKTKTEMFYGTVMRIRNFITMIRHQQVFSVENVVFWQEKEQNKVELSAYLTMCVLR